MDLSVRVTLGIILGGLIACVGLGMLVSSGSMPGEYAGGLALFSLCLTLVGLFVVVGTMIDFIRRLARR